MKYILNSYLLIIFVMIFYQITFASEIDINMIDIRKEQKEFEFIINPFANKSMSSCGSYICN